VLTLTKARAFALMWWMICVIVGAGCADVLDEPLGSGTAPLLAVSDCPAGYNVIVAAPGQVDINGTTQSDCIIGNGLDNVINGKGGDDLLVGGMGDDTINGGAGDDVIYGETGNDVLSGGSGNDQLYGGDGDDELLGGKDDDFLSGGPGNDTLRGGNGNDVLHGDEGNDDLNGGKGDDILNGGPGDDLLNGGGGSDFLVGGGGNDTIVGGGNQEEDVSVAVALNDPPKIETLSVAPSRFITTCESAQIAAVASDPNGDALDYSWLVDVTPSGAALTAVPAGPGLTFATDTPGEYLLRVIVADAHGGEAELSWAMHVSSCP